MAAVTPMSTLPISAASQTPRFPPPYPGLRPFQPDDSEYFFGREAPVREVVSRLRAERFVAVIGGSGSGKSSLVLAGAIPRLRSFAIRDAGDFWVPIVSTPGTDPVGNDTPLRRLARKFCAQLRAPIGETPQERVEACLELLRQPGGLGRLVDLYGNQVRDLDGVDPDNLKVNYLFLIDQFEELFHRSNRTPLVEVDCRHLVQRIVEHTKPQHRHAKVCIALTMRSEHLNDCPRYEELPDAINRAFYLVRRLDEEQIGQAIQQPALRYLRKCMAAERHVIREGEGESEQALPTAWPDGVSFEPALLKRLQRDAAAILAEKEHADQLPLLQHVMFWTWDAAVRRCEGAVVPDSVTLEDMLCAIHPDGVPDGMVVGDDTNVLKACLENRCKAIYGAHADLQSVWMLVFRELAFKEPNTGSYTQQRASMATLSERHGLAKADSFAALKAVLTPWLKPHHYLHWDIDSQTVKVAHETLIRRWSQFRTWTDENDRQFQMYARLLDECREWKEAGEAEHQLASGNSLLLYENLKLPDALADPVMERRLRRLLDLDRDGKQLACHADGAKDFLLGSLAYRERSRAREAEERERMAFAQREAALQRWRRLRERRYAWSGVALVSGMAAVLVVMWIALSGVSQKELTVHRGYALAAETQVNVRTQVGAYEQPQFALRTSLLASQFVLDGRARQTRTAEALNAVPVFDWFGPRLDALRNAELLAEARSIANLRNTLVGVPWKVPTQVRLEQPISFLCKNGVPGNMESARYFPRPGAPHAGLIVSWIKSWGYVIHTATSAAAGGCTFGEVVFAVPNDTGVQGLAVDRFLQNIVMSFKGYTQYHVVNWQNPAEPLIEARAVVHEPWDHNGISELPSRRAGVATDVRVGAVSVRLFDMHPGPVDDSTVRGSETLLSVSKMPAESICATFAAHRTPQNDEVLYGLSPSAGRGAGGDGRALCMVVKRTPASQGKPHYYGEVFAFADVRAARDKLKRLPLLENIPLGETLPQQLHVHRAKGWLAFRADEKARWRAIPWALEAWRAEAASVMSSKNYPEERVPELSRPLMLILSGVDTDRSGTPSAPQPAASGTAAPPPS